MCGVVVVVVTVVMCRVVVVVTLHACNIGVLSGALSVIVMLFIM